MNERPDYDPEKNFSYIRGQWKPTPDYLGTELKRLEDYLHKQIDDIREQLSALFQLASLNVKDRIDHAIDYDVNQDKLRDFDLRIHNLEEWIGVETDELRKRFEADE